MNSFDDIDDDGWSALERLARSLHVDEGGLETTLLAIVESVVETLDCTDFAGLNLLVRGKFLPQVTVGEPPARLDAFQQQTSQGPCVDASRDQVTVTIKDMACEDRWPRFAALARSCGVQSMLCLPLWVDRARLGSLSLYARSARAFAARERHLADLFATHAALALADAQRTDKLRVAMANRDVIGMAKGILMERHRITPDRAFDALSKTSQQTNQRLHVVAQRLVETGELP
jgi:GAF domain-containing protein